MVRFARSGGEANAVAVRIARAVAAHKVAICGYHGWCDWYLAANIASDDTRADICCPAHRLCSQWPCLIHTAL